MSYLKIKHDGTTVPMGSIVGYRVWYTDLKSNKRKKALYRDGNQVKDIFTMFWKASQYANNMRSGAQPRVTPVYSSELASAVAPAAS
jgi:hypothetical protein